MKTEPNKVYVYQPFPPQPDGRFYGVAGLPGVIGMIRGITKADAEAIAEACNVSPNPQSAAGLVRAVSELIENDWIPECGCRFESLFSSSVLLCESCGDSLCHDAAGIEELERRLEELEKEE